MTDTEKLAQIEAAIKGMEKNGTTRSSRGTYLILKDKRRELQARISQSPTQVAPNASR